MVCRLEKYLIFEKICDDVEEKIVGLFVDGYFVGKFVGTIEGHSEGLVEGCVFEG